MSYVRTCTRGQTLPPSLASSCAKLCERFAAAAVDLRRRQEQPLTILSAISTGLVAVLTLLKAGQLLLHDGDCVRLFTTAVVPLELSASRLQALVREAEALQRQPPSGQRSMELAELRAELAELLCSSGLGAERLLSCVSPDSRLAPRVQSVLLAGALRPSSLQSWLRATAAAAHCLICWAQGSDGEGRMAMVLQPMLSTVELINDDHRTNEAMARLRDEAPEAHRQLVGVAASAYCSLLSPGGQPLPDDTEVWALEMAAASILAASLASPVRWQRELAAWRGSDDGGGSGETPSVLLRAAELASARDMAQAPDAQAHFPRMHSQRLALQLMRDAADEQEEGGATVPPGLLRAVVSTLCTLAHALHDAAAAVAAAAPPAAGQDPLTFGSACWKCPQSWTYMMAEWALAASSLADLDISAALDRHPDPSGAAVATCTAVVALLRLLPLLPAQPVMSGEGTGVVTAAVAVAAVGGVTALDRIFLSSEDEKTLFEVPGVAAMVLTSMVPPLAASLLRHGYGLAREAAARGAPHCDRDGAAALTSLAAACRYAHALAAALGLGDAVPSSSEAAPQLLVLPARSLVLEAAELLNTTWQVFEQYHKHSAVPNHDQARRLDCGLLLYVSALRALPLSAGRALPDSSADDSDDSDDEAGPLEDWATCGRARCASLLHGLSTAGPPDGSLLLQLLQSGGGLPLGAAAAETFTQASSESLQICLLQQTGRRCMPALELLVAALCHESVPAAAVAVMAGDYELLRVLCATGRQAAVAAEVNAEALAPLRLVLQALEPLVPHVPALDPACSSSFWAGQVTCKQSPACCKAWRMRCPPSQPSSRGSTHASLSAPKHNRWRCAALTLWQSWAAPTCAAPTWPGIRGPGGGGAAAATWCGTAARHAAVPTGPRTR